MAPEPGHEVRPFHREPVRHHAAHAETREVHPRPVYGVDGASCLERDELRDEGDIIDVMDALAAARRLDGLAIRAARAPLVRVARRPRHGKLVCVRQRLEPGPPRAVRRAPAAAVHVDHEWDLRAAARCVRPPTPHGVVRRTFDARATGGDELVGVESRVGAVSGAHGRLVLLL